jgi:hypothetical protein
MTIAPFPVTRLTLPVHLTASQFHPLAAIPPELDWFANLTNANPERRTSRTSKTLWPIRAGSGPNSSGTLPAPM